MGRRVGRRLGPRRCGQGFRAEISNGFGEGFRKGKTSLGRGRLTPLSGRDYNPWRGWRQRFVPKVRCQQCGAINETRAPDYPFCVGCQNNLAKCGYCRWFNDEAAVCTKAEVAGMFEVSEDATPPCGYHSPRESVVVRQRPRPALVAVGLAAALFALGYALVWLLWMPTPTAAPQAELELAIEADYRAAVLQEPYTVTALIYNPSDVVADGVRLEIRKDSLERFELRSVRPEPTWCTESGQWRVLVYAGMHPRERRRIALDLIPLEAGSYHLVVALRSGESTYHGMADLPITVEAEARERR